MTTYPLQKAETWRREDEEGMVFEGSMRGGIPHGLFQQWYPNGQLRIQRGYQDGKLHGVCRQYAPNGSLLVEFTMNDGDGILLEHWDTGTLKLRWRTFHVVEKPCAMMEIFDIHGVHAIRSYTWKGRPCRTRKRFLGELSKSGLVLPIEEKINDPGVWAEFAQSARSTVPPTTDRGGC